MPADVQLYFAMWFNQCFPVTFVSRKSLSLIKKSYVRPKLCIPWKWICSLSIQSSTTNDAAFHCRHSSLAVE